MANSFIIKMSLDAASNTFGLGGGLKTLDLSGESTSVSLSAGKDVKLVKMPRSKTKWTNTKPETRGYDFKRIDYTLTVGGFLTDDSASAGDSAVAKLKYILAFKEQGGPLSFLEWGKGSETIFNGNTTDSGASTWFLTNATFDEVVGEIGATSEASANPNEAVFSYNLVFKKGKLR